MKLLVWLVIISLLIKPIGYIIIFLILAGVMIKERLHKKKKGKEE